MTSTVKALFLGDIFGQPGCRAVFFKLKSLKQTLKADMVCVNGENADDGSGISPEIADRLFTAGADVITTGNHVWQNRTIFPYMQGRPDFLRPVNYPAGVPGNGWFLFTLKNGTKTAVINVQGRIHMSDVDCPFSTLDRLIPVIAKQTKIIFIDFHAESVDEKEALAMYIDGRVSAILGTHTHVQTADERILPGGTAYISDIGMCGPTASVIGCRKDLSIARALTQMPLKLETEESNAQLNGVFVSVDSETGKALSIERISDPVSR